MMVFAWGGWFTVKSRLELFPGEWFFLRKLLLQPPILSDYWVTIAAALLTQTT